MRRYGIDMKGIMNSDAVVVICTGRGGLQPAASLRSGGYTRSIDLVGDGRYQSKSAQLRRRAEHRAVTRTAPVHPHTGTGG